MHRTFCFKEKINKKEESINVDILRNIMSNIKAWYSVIHHEYNSS